MNNKKCEVCGELYCTDTFSSCPHCRLMAEGQIPEDLIANYEEYKKDTTFRIENNPGEMESIKEDVKSLIVLIIILSFIILLLLPWITIMGLVFPLENIIGLFIFLVLFTIICLFGLIYLVNTLIKIKHLMKKGIILKNVQFVAVNATTSEGTRPSLLKVKIKYVGDNGIEHELKELCQA